MDRSEILSKVAPCSLLCHTCSGYKEGIICESSKTLLKYLEGIREFYGRHIPGAVESYKNFEGVLGMYSSASCSGCRSTEHNGCSIQGCFLLECTKNHAVDFCGECNEFPCKKTRELFEAEVYDMLSISNGWMVINKSGNRESKSLWKKILINRIIKHIKNEIVMHKGSGNL